MRAPTLVGLAAALIIATGCASGLRPAPGAATLAGPGASARGTDAGVRLEVRTDIEHPRELTQPVTALFVVVENRSGRDLAIRPEAFNLIATGRKHPAIPADRLRRSESSVEADIAVAMRALPARRTGVGWADGRLRVFRWIERKRAADADFRAART